MLIGENKQVCGKHLKVLSYGGFSHESPSC